jgi:hypothetical protein
MLFSVVRRHSKFQAKSAIYSGSSVHRWSLVSPAIHRRHPGPWVFVTGTARGFDGEINVRRLSLWDAIELSTRGGINHHERLATRCVSHRPPMNSLSMCAIVVMAHS